MGMAGDYYSLDGSGIVFWIPAAMKPMNLEDLGEALEDTDVLAAFQTDDKNFGLIITLYDMECEDIVDFAERVLQEESFEQNIIRTILNESSPVFLYASNILLTDYTNAVNAERILAVLGNGKKKYTELERALQANSTGSLAKQLKSLQATELIHQLFPINRPDDSKKKFYEINDNLLRFWFTYLYLNRSALQMIGPKAFFDRQVAPTLLTEYVSHRFEELCRSFFSRLAGNGQLPGITNIGTYYYDDPVRHRNGEFDVALEFGNQYQIYEAKYYKKPMALSEIHKEIRQVRNIESLNVVQLGFIAVNGFEKQEDGVHCYNGEDLYR